MGSVISTTFFRNRFYLPAQAQKLSAKVGSRLVEVDRGKAKLIGSRDVVGAVINEDRSGHIQVAPPNELLEDLWIGFDHPNVAREDQFIKGVEEGI